MKVVRRWLDRISFVGVSSGVFLFGYLQGTYAMTFRLEFAFVVLAVVLLQAVVSSLMFTGFITVSTVTFLWNRLQTPDSEHTSTGASITAIVPVYRDATVLHRSVESLLESDYENLDVCIVCEPDDTASIRRAEQLAQTDGVEYLVNDRNPGSKASAINYAAEQTESDHIAVFDADERVHPDYVSSAVTKLEDCDVVQGRTVPEPSGIVEEIAYYESVLLSYVARRLLYVFTDFRMAASRAVVMRREAFNEAGGYDTEMLTEDFDFAYQCYKRRLDVREQLAYPSKIEAAHSLSDWWGQRKRWMTGYAQVLHKLLADVRPVTRYRNLTSAAICTSTVIGSLLMLSLLSKFAVLLVIGANGLFALPIATVIVATTAIRLIDWQTDAVDSIGWGMVLVPIIFPLYSLTAIKAVIEYLFSWNGGWYSVEKGV